VDAGRQPGLVGAGGVAVRPSRSGRAAGWPGNPDPSSGATGANVYGVNLGGNFATQQGGPYYLTAGPVDLSGVTGGRLKFQRWLNILGAPYVSATVRGFERRRALDDPLVGEPADLDNAWRKVTLDISSIADGRPAVWFRWG